MGKAQRVAKEKQAHRKQNCLVRERRTRGTNRKKLETGIQEQKETRGEAVVETEKVFIVFGAAERRGVFFLFFVGIFARSDREDQFFWWCVFGEQHRPRASVFVVEESLACV
ncbi:MAG: uncharacterized protein A8A55_2318 [Amphiamblys sp. WSBS2006]|nr:MAG: uncharacterized protein A8A55_2318 [Amphiamblys sp. WSBS2006]